MKARSFKVTDLEEIISVINMMPDDKSGSDRAKARLIRKYYTLFESYLQGDGYVISVLNSVCNKPIYQAHLAKALVYFRDYLDKGLFHDPEELYGCTESQLTKRLMVLNEIYLVLTSKLNDLVKAQLIYANYHSLSSFIKDFKSISKKGAGDKKLNIAKTALEDFDFICEKFKEFEDRGYFVDVKYYNNNEGFFNILSYARFVVNFYIDYVQTDCNYDFLDELGIYKEYFDYCVSAVEELDVDLYRKYLNAVPQKEQERDDLYRNTIHEIALAIKSGSFSDGKAMSTIEFINRIPFKYSDRFYSRISKFMDEHVNDDDKQTIIYYIHANQINRNSLYLPLDISLLRTTEFKILGVTLQSSDKEVILDYLIKNGLSLDFYTYREAAAAYIKGTLDLENNNQSTDKRIKKTLIPTQQKKSR